MSKNKRFIFIAMFAFIFCFASFIGTFSNYSKSIVSADNFFEKDFSIEGASVKYKRTPTESGLRFHANMSDSIYNTLYDEVNKTWKSGIEVGLLLIPDALTNGPVTIDTPKVKRVVLNANEWIDKTAGFKKCCVYIYNYPSKYYNLDIKAVAYKKEGNVITYTNESMRSLAQVAKLALDDTSSSITPEQRSMLEGYLLDYKVTFKNGDKLLQTVSLKYGAQLTYSAVTPTKEASTYYTYTFDGWANTVNGEKLPDDYKVKEDVTLYPHFAEIGNNYNVSIAVNNSQYGSVSISTINAPYGSQIIADGNNIIINNQTIVATQKALDATNLYLFESWNYVGNTTTDNYTITANFKCMNIVDTLTPKEYYSSDKLLSFADCCNVDYMETLSYKSIGANAYLAEPNGAWASGQGLIDALEYIKNACGLDVYIRLHNIEQLNNYVNLDLSTTSVKGFYIYDEPSFAQIDNIAQIVNLWNTSFATKYEWYVNLYPSYATQAELGGTFQNYIDTYCNKVLSKINGKKSFGIDSYILTTNGYNTKTLRGTTLSDYLYVAQKAKQYNAELHGVIYTTSGVTSLRNITNEEQIRWQYWLNLAFGASEFECFEYLPNPNVGLGGMTGTSIDGLGNSRGQWNNAILSELNSFQSVYNSFTWDGAWTFGNDVAFAKMSNKLATLNNVSVTATGKTLVGQFSCDGDNAFVVTNYSDPDSNTTDNVTMTFNSKFNRVAVYKNGVKEIIALDSNNAITIRLTKGNGAFVIPVVDVLKAPENVAFSNGTVTWNANHNCTFYTIKVNGVETIINTNSYTLGSGSFEVSVKANANNGYSESVYSEPINCFNYAPGILLDFDSNATKTLIQSLDANIPNTWKNNPWWYANDVIANCNSGELNISYKKASQSNHAVITIKLTDIYNVANLSGDIKIRIKGNLLLEQGNPYLVYDGSTDARISGVTMIDDGATGYKIITIPKASLSGSISAIGIDLDTPNGINEVIFDWIKLALGSPTLSYNNKTNRVEWNSVNGASSYTVEINGVQYSTTNTYYPINENANVKVKAVDAEGLLTSVASIINVISVADGYVAEFNNDVYTNIISKPNQIGDYNWWWTPSAVSSQYISNGVVGAENGNAVKINVNMSGNGTGGFGIKIPAHTDKGTQVVIKIKGLDNPKPMFVNKGWQSECAGFVVKTDTNGWSYVYITDYCIHNVSFEGGYKFNEIDWYFSGGANQVKEVYIDYIEFVKTLSAPTNLAINNKLLTWNSVKNAQSYAVIVNGNEVASNITATSYTLTGDMTSAIVKVKAIGDGLVFNDSAESDSVTYIRLENGVLAAYDDIIYKSFIHSQNSGVGGTYLPNDYYANGYWTTSFVKKEYIANYAGSHGGAVEFTTGNPVNNAQFFFALEMPKVVSPSDITGDIIIRVKGDTIDTRLWTNNVTANAHTITVTDDGATGWKLIRIPQSVLANWNGRYLGFLWSANSTFAIDWIHMEMAV